MISQESTRSKRLSRPTYRKVLSLREKEAAANKAEKAAQKEEWDRMEGAKLSIATIKSMRRVDWKELSIPFGIGKSLSRRAEVFEAKVKSGDWLILGSQL